MTETTTGIPRDAAEIRRTASVYDPDPFPKRPDSFDEGSEQWQYLRGQFELGLLHRLVAEGFAANRFVHYARNYGDLEPRVLFRHALNGHPEQLTFRTNGTVRVMVDDGPLEHRADGAARRLANVPAGGTWLVLEVLAPDDEPAALLARVGGVLPAAGSWECSVDGTAWQSACPRRGSELQAPHARREPVLALQPEGADGVYELPAPVLGRPVIECDGRPILNSGESRQEATDLDAVQESSHEVVLRPDGRWTTRHALGFRFLSVSGARVRSVTVEASVHPVARRGAFVCADPLLSRIWAHSAFTLRTCMHELMLDGIKRDRMPWMGDQALNTLANAYAFGEGGIIRDGIVALGSPRHGYVNGISDYSLWWLINTASYVELFGDVDHAVRDAAQVHAFAEGLAGFAGPGGLFRPRDEEDGFIGASEGSVFLDWGVAPERGRDLTALQILWFWALRSATGLLALADHPGAGRWADLAEKVRATLSREAWDETTGTWSEYLGVTRPSPYPNFLAVVSGLSPAPAPAGVVEAIMAGEAGIGTPFMATFALRALLLSGESAHAVQAIRERWGAMLEAGAVTFWEEFATPGVAPLAMYGRPYGKSLCHAWAAGPAALLPEALLGIRPLSPGWRTFEVRPALGGLWWAAAVVPVPHGEVAVSADGDAVAVDVPAGTTLVRDSEAWEGPCRIAWHGSGPAAPVDWAE